MSLISVIIPIYNAGEFLTPCLESIINQTYRNIEIILINDGSTDDSLQICTEYAQNDSRVIVIDQKNSGVSTARNNGLAVCKGEWVSFVDSDDFLELNAYEHCMHIIEEHPCDAVCFDYFANFKTYENKHHSDPKFYGMMDRRQSMHLLRRGLPFTWCRLFSRKIIGDTLFDTEIARGEDGKFNTEVLHRANKVYFTPKALYHYVQSDESACRGKFRPSQLTALKLIDFYPDFLGEHYPELLPEFYCDISHLIVTLYMDMEFDKTDYRKEQKMCHDRFVSLYKIVKKMNCSYKEMIKFFVFRFTPRLLCLWRRLSAFLN